MTNTLEKKAEIFLKESNQSVKMGLLTIIGFFLIAIGLSFLEKINFSIIISILAFIWIIEQFFYFLIIKRQKTIFRIRFVFLSEFVFNFLILTLVIHYMGGIEWMGVILYLYSIVYIVFHVPQKNIKIFLISFAFLLYAILVILEYLGTISHYGIVPSCGAYQNLSYVIVTLSMVGAIFIFTTFTINLFASKLKKRTEELEEIKITLEKKVELRTERLGSLTENLEQEVEKRTKELKKRVNELENFYKLTIGRETKMIELKEEIKKLKEQK